MANIMDHAPTMTDSSDELAKLIRKLRWSGLEDEAQQLQHALKALPAEERGRGTVSEGPFSTD